MTQSCIFSEKSNKLSFNLQNRILYVRFGALTCPSVATKDAHGNGKIERG